MQADEFTFRVGASQLGIQRAGDNFTLTRWNRLCHDGGLGKIISPGPLITSIETIHGNQQVGIYGTRPGPARHA